MCYIFYFVQNINTEIKYLFFGIFKLILFSETGFVRRPLVYKPLNTVQYTRKQNKYKA